MVKNRKKNDILKGNQLIVTNKDNVIKWGNNACCSKLKEVPENEQQ